MKHYRREIFCCFKSYAYSFDLCRPVAEGLVTSMGDMPAACITKHPMISEELDPAEMKQRALLVALGLVYYMRLDSKYRVEFSKELDKMIPGVKFLTAFTEEV